MKRDKKVLGGGFWIPFETSGLDELNITPTAYLHIVEYLQESGNLRLTLQIIQNIATSSMESGTIQHSNIFRIRADTPEKMINFWIVPMRNLQYISLFGIK